jgi:hypothetical protein
MFKVALPLLILLIVAVIVFAPLAYIWALNTLFPSLNIAYSVESWLAICLAHSFFHQTISVKK